MFHKNLQLPTAFLTTPLHEDLVSQFTEKDDWEHCFMGVCLKQIENFLV